MAGITNTKAPKTQSVTPKVAARPKSEVRAQKAPVAKNDGFNSGSGSNRELREGSGKERNSTLMNMFSAEAEPNENTYEPGPGPEDSKRPRERTAKDDLWDFKKAIHKNESEHQAAKIDIHRTTAKNINNTSAQFKADRHKSAAAIYTKTQALLLE